ncbi:brain-specific serine protease 4-like [Panulirus ornatus]|uniref:brain-specific serine protease 4-like n=1 Tax=Panulirus ornatus TaxID=150431 RepID=UPI003A85F2D6
MKARPGMVKGKHVKHVSPPVRPGGSGATRPRLPSPRLCRRSVVNEAFVRIVGGIESEPHSWPWMVVSFRNLYGAHLCAGSLITSKHVPYCRPRHPLGFGVVSEFDADLAIVTLLRDVTFNKTVSPVCLPSGVSPPGTTVTVVGWGYVDEGGPPAKILRETNITLLNSSSFRVSQDLLTEGMLCGGTAQRDACEGDSKGPLLVQTDGSCHLAGLLRIEVAGGKPQSGSWPKIVDQKCATGPRSRALLWGRVPRARIPEVTKRIWEYDH